MIPVLPTVPASNLVRAVRAAFGLTYLLAALCASAAGIELPPELGAQARIERGERDGLPEKTLVVRLDGARHALSTSDGLLTARAALNHGAHPLLWERVAGTFQGRDGQGGKAYTEYVVRETARRLNLPRRAVAHMATAADLDNLAVVTRSHGPLTVTVLATAGAKSNAQRTGVDGGSYIEGLEPKGTINLLVLSNVQLSDAALARALITVTEGKTAALEDLKVPSTYTPQVQATGTGTDSIVVVSGTALPRATYTGGHSKLGELIGKASYQAVVEALGKQNGFFLPGAKRFDDVRGGPTKADGDLRLALLHLDPRPGDIAGNRARIEAGIRSAVANGADWVVTPELAETGYYFAKRVGTDWIAPFPDAWISTLAAIARDNGVALFVGFAERDPLTRKLHNSVAVIDRQGRLLGRYRKQRVIGGAENWSLPGDTAEPFDVDGVPVGVMVCADAYYPAIAARLAGQGARILLVPTNWPPVDGMGPGDTWIKRSAENGLPVVAVNRTGVEPELDFTRGESVVAVAGQTVLNRHDAEARIFYIDWNGQADFRSVPDRTGEP